MLRLLLAALAALLLAGLPAAAERKVALVIGNDGYANVPPLRKARADAEGYRDYLAAEGFEVLIGLDLAAPAMRELLAAFLDRIQPGDTVVFAFAGHGWSDGRQNFLMATDIRQEASETLLAAESFPLRNGVNGILDLIAARGPRLAVAIIDACRNNPFRAPGGTRSLGLARGLVAVSAPAGTFVAFSAGEGQEALDRLSAEDPEPNSVFTRYFLAELRKGQDLQTAFKATQAVVAEVAARANHAQRPAYYDEVTGRACLAAACADPAAPDRAARDWEQVKDTTSEAALERFAAAHPGTVQEALALERLARLRAEREAASRPAPGTAPPAATTNPPAATTTAPPAATTATPPAATPAPGHVIGDVTRADPAPSRPFVVPSVPAKPPAAATPSPAPETGVIVVDATGRGTVRSLAEAVARAKPGDRIEVRPGRYRGGVTVEIPLEIVGTGDRARIVIEATGADVIHWRAPSGRIANLTLLQGGGAFSAVFFDRGSATLEGSDLASKGNAVVAVKGPAAPVIRDNLIRDGTLGGLFVYEGARPRVEGNEFRANRGAAISVVRGGDPTVLRNRITGGNEVGLFVFEEGRGHFEDNDIEACTQSGVAILSGGDPLVVRNRIRRNGRIGVAVSQDGRGRIERNEITGNGEAGIHVESGAPVIVGNLVRDQDAAVVLSERAAGELTRNDLRGNRSWTILRHPAARTVIRENTER